MDPLIGTTADSESRLSYPGWKVSLAGFFGVMVSFSAIVPYTFSLFLKPLSTQLRMAPGSYLRRLQHRRIDGGRSRSGVGLSARPVRSAPHHPSVHSDFFIHLRIDGPAHATPGAGFI